MRPLLALACVAVLASPAAVTAAGPPAPPTGEALFARNCAACHEAGGWGTRMLARRMPAERAELRKRPAVPAALVRVVVRRGIGSMPQFTPTDLSDAELERLARWLETRR